MCMMMDISKELSRFEVGSAERIFFENLYEKLAPNFIRSSVEDKLREARNNLNCAMHNYFQSYIFASTVMKSTEQLEILQEHSSSNIPLVYLNFVQQFFPSEYSEKPTLFGLSRENITETIKSKKAKAEIATLKKLVEDNINDFCIRLTQCVGGTVLPGCDWKYAFDRVIKDLEYKATFLSSEESKQQSRKILRNMIKTYYEELNKGILLLNKLLTLHSEHLEFESVLAKYYLQRCYAVYLKIKLFEMKLLKTTYDQETVPALKKISAHLDEREQKLKQEKNEKTVALEQYLKLGEEYQQLVGEYARLTKTIREQQWAIDEMKSSKSQYS